LNDALKSRGKLGLLSEYYATMRRRLSLSDVRALEAKPTSTDS